LDAFVSVTLGNTLPPPGKMGAVVNVFVPLMVWLPSVMTNCEFAPLSGMVYVRLVPEWGPVSTMLPAPLFRVIWLVELVNTKVLTPAANTGVELNVTIPLIVCAPFDMTKTEFVPTSGMV